MASDVMGGRASALPGAACASNEHADSSVGPDGGRSAGDDVTSPELALSQTRAAKLLELAAASRDGGVATHAKATTSDTNTRELYARIPAATITKARARGRFNPD
jgi:hypothetical protein